MNRKTPPQFNAKALLAKVGLGRSISKYDSNQTIFQQGDAADAVFYIQSGEADGRVRAGQGGPHCCLAAISSVRGA